MRCVVRHPVVLSVSCCAFTLSALSAKPYCCTDCCVAPVFWGKTATRVTKYLIQSCPHGKKHFKAPSPLESIVLNRQNAYAKHVKRTYTSTRSQQMHHSNQCTYTHHGGQKETRHGPHSKLTPQHLPTNQPTNQPGHTSRVIWNTAASSSEGLEPRPRPPASLSSRTRHQWKTLSQRMSPSNTGMWVSTHRPTGHHRPSRRRRRAFLRPPFTPLPLLPPPRPLPLAPPFRGGARRQDNELKNFEIFGREEMGACLFGS